MVTISQATLYCQSELGAESGRFGDSHKNLRKSERKIKELTFAADEDKKNHKRMQALIDQMQSNVKSYKKQIKEAEEIASLNLANLRQTQGCLGLAEEDQAAEGEQVLASIGLVSRNYWYPSTKLLSFRCKIFKLNIKTTSASPGHEKIPSLLIIIYSH